MVPPDKSPQPPLDSAVALLTQGLGLGASKTELHRHDNINPHWRGRKL